MRIRKLLVLASVIISFLLIILFQINNNTSAKNFLNKHSDSENDLLKTDKEFSDMSFHDGIFKAFLTYANEDAIIIREKQFPINGKKELEEMYKSNKNINDKLSWIPVKVEVSESGELGYTFGKWNYISSERNTYPLEKYGYYSTIWKKDKDNKWKFVLYIGNSTEDDLVQFRKLK